jgi:hypothetical protein
MSVIIGIDNGISGGIVAISDYDGRIIDMTTMPVKKHRTRNEVDIRAVHLWLSQATGGNLSNADYVIEEPGGSKSAKAGISMAASFHSLRGFFETKMLNWHRVTPQSWQTYMLGKLEKGETKQAALALAKRIWSDERWLATPRCSKSHDGLIDAALIAEFHRRKNS